MSSPKTPTTCYIGDTNASETWGPKRKKSAQKHNYFNSALLKQFDSPKVKNQIFQVKDKRVASAKKLKNHLFDDPYMYFQAKERFIVAASGPQYETKLSSEEYKTLQRDQPVALGCIQFFLQLFSKKRNDIQFIVFSSLQLLSEKIEKIKKQNVIGIIQELNQFSLLIINFRSKVISHIDLTMKYPTDQMLVNVVKFLTEHNKRYNTNLSLQEWSHTKMSYPHLQYGNACDSGIYIIRFIQDLITHNSIVKKEFDVDEFRLSLSHYVLQKSACMTDFCLICGQKEDKTKNPIVHWLECERCKRWCHNACLSSTIFDKAFHCILCSFSDEN